MNIRLNTDCVLKLVCAVFLASAIGISAIGADASSCFTTRLDSDVTVIDISNGQFCDEVEPSDFGRGRPGMRFLKDVA
jgi:hypothetical protein